MAAAEEPARKTILFFPLNSPGHINSSLGIADRIKAVHQCRTVFLLLGPMIGDSIRQHGHELVTLEEASPYEDYEILNDEDPDAPVDEQLMRRLGREKKRFVGVYKWPQIMLRNQRMMRLPPLEAFLESCSLLDGVMVGELIDNQANYAAAIEKIKPDLIVMDAYYLPPCVVAQSRVPWVRLYSANPMMVLESCLPDGVQPPAMIGVRLYDRETRQRMRQEEPDKWQAMLDDWRRTNERMFASMEQAATRLQEYLVAQGCERLPPGKQAPDSKHLNIYMFPKAIDYDQDTDLFKYPPRWFRCDSLMRKQPSPAESAELRAWAQKLGSRMINREAVIYFSLGSLASGITSLMKRFVEMLAHDTRRLYVVSKGVNGDQYELNESNMIGGNYLPQNYFLQRADLAIVHGGNNSVTECLFHGLPMIVLPVFSDQLDNAQRIEDLGLGRRLDVHKCTRDELLGALDELLADQQVRERTRRIGEAMQKRDDLAKVVGMLDKLMTEGSLDEHYIEQMARDA
jgi:MGT family glycosyltransferase